MLCVLVPFSLCSNCTTRNKEEEEDLLWAFVILSLSALQWTAADHTDSYCIASEKKYTALISKLHFYCVCVNTVLTFSRLSQQNVFFGTQFNFPTQHDDEIGLLFSRGMKEKKRGERKWEMEVR